MKYYYSATVTAHKALVEPVTLSKYAEYEEMWKWMVEFLSKFWGRHIRIDRVNSVRLAKSIIFFNILLVGAR